MSIFSQTAQDAFDTIASPFREERAPVDVSKVKRNVGRMVAQGAKQGEIDQYISSEGVTLAQVQAASFDKMDPVDQYHERRRQLNLPLTSNTPRFQGQMFGGGDEVVAGAKTIFSYVPGNTHGVDFGRMSFWDRFKRFQDYERAQIEERRAKAMPGEELLGSLETGVVLPAGRAVATLGQAVKQGAKVGAGFGAVQGFLDTDGTVADRTKGAGFGAAGGALFGAAAPVAISGVQAVGRGAGSIWQRMTGTGATDRIMARAAADDFAAAGVTPFGPALADGTSARTAESLAGSVVGGGLRRGAAQSISELESGLLNTIGRAGAERSPSEAGAAAQTLTRRNLFEHSTPPNRIEAMTPDELAAISRMDPNAPAPTPRPYVDPIPPRNVDPVQPVYPSDPPRPTVPPVPVEVPMAPTATPRKVNPADFDTQIPKDVLIAHEKLNDRIVAIAQEHDALIGQAAKFPRIARTPQEVQARDALFQRLEQLRGEHQALTAQRQAQLAEWSGKRDAWVKSQEDLAAREAVDLTTRRQDALSQQAQRQADVTRSQIQSAEDQRWQQSVWKQRAQADADAAAATAQARKAAVDEASLRTRAAQDAAEAEYQRLYAKGPPQWQTGRNPQHTYPTEFAAGYEQVSRQIPGTAREPLVSPDKAIFGVLEDFRSQLRRDGLLRGDNPSQSFREGKTSLVFRKHMNDLVGEDITGYLFRTTPVGFDTIRRVRTAVRELRTNPPGDRKLSDVHLAKIEGALTEDIQAFMRKRGFDLAADRTAVIDRGYRAFKEDITYPLRRITKGSVTAEQAFDRMMDAAKGGDMRMLRAYFKVAAEKGEPEAAAASLVAHMVDGGISKFAKEFGALTPEAKQVMFSGQASELGTALERYWRLAKRLAPYEQVAKKGYSIDLSRPGNIMIGAAGWLLSWQSAVAAIVGQAGLAKFMASPAYVNWVTKAVQLQSSGAPQRVVQHHMTKAGAAFRDNPALGEFLAEEIGFEGRDKGKRK